MVNTQESQRCNMSIWGLIINVISCFMDVIKHAYLVIIHTIRGCWAVLNNNPKKLVKMICTIPAVIFVIVLQIIYVVYRIFVLFSNFIVINAFKRELYRVIPTFFKNSGSDSKLVESEFSDSVILNIFFIVLFLVLSLIHLGITQNILYSSFNQFFGSFECHSVLQVGATLINDINVGNSMEDKTNQYDIYSIIAILGFAYISILGYLKTKKVYVGQDIDSNGAIYFSIITIVDNILFLIVPFLIIYLALFPTTGYLEVSFLILTFIASLFFKRSRKIYKKKLKSYDFIDNFNNTPEKIFELTSENTDNVESNYSEENIKAVTRARIDFEKSLRALYDAMFRFVILSMHKLDKFIILGFMRNKVFSDGIVILSLIVLYCGIVNNFNIFSIMYLLVSQIFWYFTLSLISHGIPKKTSDIYFNNNLEPMKKVYIIYENPDDEHIVVVTEKNHIQRIFKNSICKVE
ncbi:hypothetical protein [Methanococcus sp. CF]